MTRPARETSRGHPRRPRPFRKGKMMTFQTKDDALDAMECARKDWLSKVSVFLDGFGPGDRLTVNDVRAAVPIPSGVDPRVMGCVFRRGWNAVAFVNSERDTCHNRPIRIFEKVSV